MKFPKIAENLPRAQEALRKFWNTESNFTSNKAMQKAVVKTNAVLEPIAQAAAEETNNNWRTIKSVFGPSNKYELWGGFEKEGFFVRMAAMQTMHDIQ